MTSKSMMSLPLLVGLLCATTVRAEDLEPPLLMLEQAHIAATSCQFVTGGTNVDGTKLVIASCGTTMVIDVDDPTAPIVRSTIPSVSDVAFHDGILYRYNDIYDLRDPDHPVKLTTLTGGPQNPHGISYDPEAAQLYVVTLAGSFSSVYVLTNFDPDAPPGSLGASFTIDEKAVDINSQHTFYYPGSGGGIYYFPLSGAQPFLVGTHPGPVGPGELAHTVAATADDRFIVAEKEGFGLCDPLCASNWMNQGFPIYGSDGDAQNCGSTPCTAAGGITLFEADFSTSPYVSVQRGTFHLPDTVAGSAHKLEVEGDYVYTAFYQGGVQVMRIDRNEAPVSWHHQASFDTNTLPLIDESGAFDVFPHLGPDRVVVVDNTTGVWILKHITDELLAAYMTVLS